MTTRISLKSKFRFCAAGSSLINILSDNGTTDSLDPFKIDSATSMVVSYLRMKSLCVNVAMRVVSPGSHFTEVYHNISDLAFEIIIHSKVILYPNVKLFLFGINTQIFCTNQYRMVMIIIIKDNKVVWFV